MSKATGPVNRPAWRAAYKNLNRPRTSPPPRSGRDEGKGGERSREYKDSAKEGTKASSLKHSTATF